MKTIRRTRSQGEGSTTIYFVEWTNGDGVVHLSTAYSKKANAENLYDKKEKRGFHPVIFAVSLDLLPAFLV